MLQQMVGYYFTFLIFIKINELGVDSEIKAKILSTE